jgi:hypothetical protein
VLDHSLSAGSMKATWWVIGKPDKSQFVGWSCGSPGPLEDAAVYRSEDNAAKKLKSLTKYEPQYYGGMVAMEIDVVVK